MSKYLSEQIVTDSKISSGILSLINFSKGLAISWVCLFHARFTEFGWQGVHLFIIFSGLTLTYSRFKQTNQLNWKKWYLRRLRRILPTYWLVVLLGYLVVVGSIAVQGSSLSQSFWLAKRTLLFDLTLLKSFHHEYLSTFPNVSLWFIPFILSCYLIFPLLYQTLTKCSKFVQLLLFSTGITVIEFIYRAGSIYWLDGIPIAYSSLEAVGLPLDKISDSQFPFQLSAPFGFFPSRLGEFGLGMVLGLLLVRSEESLNKALLNWWVGIFGFLLWIFANYIINTGVLGWVVGDFLITSGLTLWVLNIAVLVRNLVPILFSKLSQIGANSYYIFLIHAIFIQVLFVYLDGEQGSPYVPFSYPIVDLIRFLVILGLIWVSCKLLQKFDRSPFADWITDRTVAKLL